MPKDRKPLSDLQRFKNLSKALSEEALQPDASPAEAEPEKGEGHKQGDWEKKAAKRKQQASRKKER